MWFRNRNSDPADTVRGLSKQVFSLAAEDVGVASAPGHQRIWALLMETGYPEAVASLVTIADGTTSLYFSNGGGVIGAGEYSAVRSAATAFISAADSNIALFSPTTDHPLPDVGRVRFYARTFDGVLTAEGDEQDYGENRSPLSPLFHLGHSVIAAVREASPEAP
jgi:hypothetical protein